MKKTTTCYLTDALDSYDDGTCSPSGTGATPAFTSADNNECIAITDAGEVTIAGVSRPVDPVWAAGFTRGCSGKLKLHPRSREFEVTNRGGCTAVGEQTTLLSRKVSLLDMEVTGNPSPYCERSASEGRHNMPIPNSEACNQDDGTGCDPCMKAAFDKNQAGTRDTCDGDNYGAGACALNGGVPATVSSSRPSKGRRRVRRLLEAAEESPQQKSDDLLGLLEDAHKSRTEASATWFSCW